MTLLGERIPTLAEWRKATGGSRLEYWKLYDPPKAERWLEQKARAKSSNTQKHTMKMRVHQQDRFHSLFSGITPTELIVDLFCGGGGAGEGIEQGLGRPADIAVNHDEHAISMHTVNHPLTEHHQTDVFDVNPVVVCKGRPVGLLWLSPDCTHFSVARGGKPKSKKIRSLAWVGILWAILVRPRVMMLENVKEFRTWGPLEPVLDKDGNHVCDKKSGEPLYDMIEGRKGETFRAFIDVLSTGLAADHPAIPEIQEALGEHFDLAVITKGLGYKVEYRDLVAADYGAPTSRLRFFMVARCDGLPITWPEPTHGAPENPEVRSGKLKPWRTAAEIIDWSIPTHSIFMTPEEVKAERKRNKNFRVNRPLVKNTLMRIAEGIKRYVLESANPFIMSYYGLKTEGEFRGQGLDQPIKTQSTENRFSLLQPVVVACGHTGPQYKTFRGHGFLEPMQTITANPGFALATPVVIKCNHTEGSHSAFRGQNILEPVQTLTSKLGFGLAVPYLLAIDHQSAKPENSVYNIEGPVGTITTENRFAATVAFLSKIRGDTASSSSSLQAPVPTIVAGSGIERPAGGGHALSVVECFVDRQFSNGKPDSIHEPLGTVTADGGGKSALVSFWVTKYFTGVVGCSVKSPLPTITAVDHNWLTSAFITNYNGMEGTSGQHQRPDAPLGTVTSTDRFNLVQLHTGRTIRDRREQVRAFAREFLGLDALIIERDGQLYEVVDIGMRMFQPHELYAAQGFPSDYIFDVGSGGKPLPKYQQTAMCGNSVCPPVPKALVQANYFEFADAYGKSGD